MDAASIGSLVQALTKGQVTRRWHLTEVGDGGHLTGVGDGVLTFGTAMRGLSEAPARPGPSSLYQM